VTGRRSNQLSYTPIKGLIILDRGRQSLGQEKNRFKTIKINYVFF
tara:strand:- start:2986 stop:3120 length:135 start_codon:yes stop_codon:yes gene_type:complete